MKIQLVLTTDFGEFLGEIFEVDEEQYRNITNLSRKYYESGLEMTLIDGSFVIFSPEVIKKSILKIKITDV
jgi:hypothetical protein